MQSLPSATRLKSSGPRRSAWCRSPRRCSSVCGHWSARSPATTTTAYSSRCPPTATRSTASMFTARSSTRFTSGRTGGSCTTLLPTVCPPASSRCCLSPQPLARSVRICTTRSTRKLSGSLTAMTILTAITTTASSRSSTSSTPVRSGQTPPAGKRPIPASAPSRATERSQRRSRRPRQTPRLSRIWSVKSLTSVRPAPRRGSPLRSSTAATRTSSTLRLGA